MRNEKADFMEANISLLTERHLETELEGLLASIGLSCIQRQLRLGAYRLDAVARDQRSRKLIVVELKTCAFLGSLSQLLLYRSALGKWLRRCDYPETSEVGALLITTFLDLEVLDTIEALGLADEIWVRVCIHDGSSLRLVDPLQVGVGSQAWYQCDENPAASLEETIRSWRDQ